MKYEFSSFNPVLRCRIQGLLEAVVFGPAGRYNDAYRLAALLADGYTRRAAVAKMLNEGDNPAGLRIKYAGRCQ